MGDDTTTHDGVTRREALKKGARLGGALVWAVPVVQTIGMSSAMAQTVSEGNCCLEIVSLVATQFGDGNDIRIAATVRNCGALELTAASAALERRFNDGPAWVGAGMFNAPDLGPGDTASMSVDRFNRPAGKYQYRVKGAFTCGGVTFEQHTVPGSEFVESNVVFSVTP